MTTFNPSGRAWFVELGSKYPDAFDKGGEEDVTYTVDRSNEKAPVGIIRMNDTKMNAFSFSMIARMGACLDEAEKDDTKAIVIAGNEKVFSAGFDLKVMRGGDPNLMWLMVNLGGELSYRMFMFPKPVVLACTGHALALGAIMLFAGDVRVGPMPEAGRKPVKVGMNEVAIGMTLPDFAFRLARSRVPIRHQTTCLTLAKVCTPEESIEYGYIDILADKPGYAGTLEKAVQQAQYLGSYLKQPAFQMQKSLERGPVATEGQAIVSKGISSMKAKL